VIEMLPKIATLLDGQVGRTLLRILKKQGFDIRLKTKVIEAKVVNRKVQVAIEAGDKKENLKFDRLLVAVGRRPLTRGLNLEKAGVRIDPKTGQVPVNEKFQTNVPDIYAIGDMVPGPMLAHTASIEGIAAVECMAGLPGEVNYDAIPAVIYTAPEVATVGLTEEQVKERGVPYCVGTYPFTGAGRARCMGETDGFVKLISHGKTDRILGVHIIGQLGGYRTDRPRSSDIFGSVDGSSRRHPQMRDLLFLDTNAKKEVAWVKKSGGKERK